MNLLSKLTRKNLKLNKKRTIVTIIGIVLSCALITALSTLVVSFKNTAIEYEKTRDGNYHVALSDVDKEEINVLKNNRKIENISFSKEIGYSLLEDIKNEDKPYLYINAYDAYSLNHLGFTLIDGRMPESIDEIVIPRHLKTNGRVDIKIGDIITLDIGERIGIDEEKLEQNNPYQKDNEEFIGKEKRTYKVVGIIERPGYGIEDYKAAGYTCLTYLDDFNDSKYQAYIRLNKDGLKDHYTTIADILDIDAALFKRVNSDEIFVVSEEEYDKLFADLNKQLEKSDYKLESIHSYLISLEHFSLNDSTMQALYNVAGIVVIIIIVTSVFCIRNSFDISITEKTRQYGMLASIGATKKQIKKNVLYEAFVLGAIGIPLGIILGLIASVVLILTTNILLKDSVNFLIVTKVSIPAIILSILLAAITIYLSAIKSARRASKISPINAIRNSNDIKIKSKKIKSSRIVKSLFGVGGDISYKNLKRNNKKYRTTVISILVCVSVFIALTSFMNSAFKEVSLQFSNRTFNIAITLDDQDEEKLDNMKKGLLNLEGIKRYALYRNKLITSSNIKPTVDYANFYYTEGFYTDDDPRMYSLNIISLGDVEYNKYLKDLNLKYDDAKDKGIVINNVMVYKEDEDGRQIRKETQAFNISSGDIISGGYYDYTSDTEKKPLDLEVIKVTNERPFTLEEVSSSFPMIIISDEMMDYLGKMNTRHDLTLEMLVEDPDSYQDEAEMLTATVTNSHITNYAKEEKQSRSIFILIGIFLYGFIMVIALIGITNIFNTITTNMELRSREFATLKSIGMTSKEFNRMIRLESIFYGSKSLITGIPIGCLLSYLLHQGMTSNGMIEFAYQIPYMAILLSILAVFILISCIMKFSINRINKQNTIETIRNDNI